MKWRHLGVGLVSLLLAASALAQVYRTRIYDPTLSDQAILERQRDLVDELARRHTGVGVGKDKERDLKALQLLVERRVFQPHQKQELQALGVVLGDVMVRELGLTWVVLEDDRARSRCLRWKDSDNLFFPVTMISKRYERGVPVDVAALYGKVEQQIRELSGDGELRFRTRFIKPRRPAPLEFE